MGFMPRILRNLKIQRFRVLLDLYRHFNNKNNDDFNVFLAGTKLAIFQHVIAESEICNLKLL